MMTNEEQIAHEILGRTMDPHRVWDWEMEIRAYCYARAPEADQVAVLESLNHQLVTGRYDVRCPGQTAWADGLSLDNAAAECAVARRTVGMPYHVYFAS